MYYIYRTYSSQEGITTLKKSLHAIFLQREICSFANIFQQAIADGLIGLQARESYNLTTK